MATLSCHSLPEPCSCDRFVVKNVVVSAFVKCFLVWRAAWSNDALSEERDDSGLLMPGGMFFVVIGGWLLLR